MRGAPSPVVRVTARHTLAPAGFTLFICMFAGQAAVIGLSPVLPKVAHHFGVSVSTAGQLRSVSGVVAGATAVLMGPITRRLGLRDLLVAGVVLLATGSFLSAVAPSLVLLALAQVPLGAGLAVVIAASTAGAAEWVSGRHQTATLSWTLIGPPVSWMVGMPVIGALGAVSWRLGFIAVPFAASMVGLATLLSRRPDPPAAPRPEGAATLRSDHGLVAWGLGELLALSAWAGTVVYAGALLITTYGIGPGAAGLILGLAAAAYLPGNFLARRWAGKPRRAPLIAFALALAVAIALFGAWRPTLAVSALLFVVLSFCAGARTFLGSAFGLVIAPERRIDAMRLRAAALQFGYLFGSAAGGAAIALSGYPALGVVFATLFAAAAIPHVIAVRRETGS
jgi:predicted MFS family arabinose efflux permease